MGYVFIPIASLVVIAGYRHMRRVSRKIFLSIILFVIINLLVIDMGFEEYIYKLSDAQIFLLEGLHFLIYQALLLLLIKKKPLEDAKDQRKLIVISESMFVFTMYFWLFYIVGPFWEHL